MNIPARRTDITRRTLAIVREHHSVSHRLASKAIHRAWIDLKTAIAADHASRGDWMNDIPASPRTPAALTHEQAAAALHAAELVGNA